MPNSSPNAKATSLPPIKWIGGKSRFVRRIVPLVDATPHRCYVEPFGGSGAILLAKRPVPVEVYNDLDTNLVTLYRTLQNPERLARLMRTLCLLPYARSLFEHPEKLACFEPAVSIMYRNRSRFPYQRNFSFAYGLKGCPMLNRAYHSAVLRLPHTAQRLAHVRIHNEDWKTVVDRYDSPDTLFYLDPPYHPDTCMVEMHYDHCLTDAQHEQLVERVVTLKGKVVLSCYPHPLYEALLQHGFQRQTWTTLCRSAPCAWRLRRTEHLYYHV